MNAELEALLRTYDAFREARRSGRQADELYGPNLLALWDLVGRRPKLL